MIPVYIIPVLNRFDLLEQTLDSIDYPIENILVIDNSNSYKTNRQNVHVLNMPANLGVAGSWNLGIKCFPHAPYWLIGSNDTAWVPGNLQKFEEASSKNKLILSIQLWNTFSLGSNIVRNIGLFDENYYPAYSEDTDYMERLRINGLLDNIVWSTAPVKQLGMSLTVKSNPSFFEKNIFTNKENNNYRMNKISENNVHLNCLQYDLQRRINHEWLDA